MSNERLIRLEESVKGFERTQTGLEKRVERLEGSLEKNDIK